MAKYLHVLVPVHCSTGQNTTYISQVFPRCSMSMSNNLEIAFKMYWTVIILNGFNIFITTNSRSATLSAQVTTC